MKKRVLIIYMLALTFCVPSAFCGSIWAKRHKSMKDYYSDDIAHNIGDILTVWITEDSTVDNKANRAMQKDTSRSMTFNGELGKFADIGEFGMSSSSGNQLNGKADFKDERSFTDRITVVVVDVLPNDNLVVMGTRTRDIAGDIQYIEASGIVRPSDINFDNTVKSEQIANFSLVTDNNGIAAPYTEPGWLGGIFDFVWPL
jgi:flagellar L-ring protein precursor FlgH